MSFTIDSAIKLLSLISCLYVRNILNVAIKLLCSHVIKDYSLDSATALLLSCHLSQVDKFVTVLHARYEAKGDSLQLTLSLLTHRLRNDIK